MQAPKKEVKLHSVTCHAGPHGMLVRVCENCGSTWFLRTHGANGEGMAWHPVFELDNQGQARPDVVIDVLYCGGDAPVTVVQTQAPATKPKGLCYCETCRVKRQHFEGDDRCFCVKCRGNHPHKSL